MLYSLVFFIQLWDSSLRMINSLKKSGAITAKTNLSLIFIFFTIQVVEGYLLEKILSGSHGEYFISTIFLTAFLFLFALNNKTLGKDLFITKVGGRALGIYIVHVVFIDIFEPALAFSGSPWKGHQCAIVVQEYGLVAFPSHIYPHISVSSN